MLPSELWLGMLKAYVYVLFQMLMLKAETLDHDDTDRKNSLYSMVLHLEYICGEWSLMAFLFYLSKAKGVDKRLLAVLWICVNIAMVSLNLSMFNIWRSTPVPDSLMPTTVQTNWSDC